METETVYVSCYQDDAWDVWGAGPDDDNVLLESHPATDPIPDEWRRVSRWLTYDTPEGGSVGAMFERPMAR